VFGLAVLVTAGGCGGQAPPAAQRAQAPPPGPRATAPQPRALPVEIVSVSPETIDVQGGRAMPTTFSVEYRIASPERVEKAELRIVAPGFGIVQREPAPVQANGVVTVAVAPIDDFGPVVRFRVTCPAGTTEWHALGARPLPYEQRSTMTFGITGVSPSHIKPDFIGERQPGSGVPISVGGRGFSPECTLEAQRDGAPIELNNPYFRDNALRGLLLHRDIGNRGISGRYLEFGLAIHGPGVGQINHRHVLFNE
jgi:hypothetical protein